MPDTPSDNQPRTEKLQVRVTPTVKNKIMAVAEIEGRPYADLMREMGVHEIERRHDRIMEMAGAGSSNGGE